MSKTIQLSTCPECNHKIRYREVIFRFRLKCPKYKIRLNKYKNEKAKRLDLLVKITVTVFLVTVGFFPEGLYIDDMTEQELAQHTFSIYYVVPFMAIVDLLGIIVLPFILKTIHHNIQFVV